MQTKVSYLSDLKFNLETWKRELKFHKNEMETFQEKLDEIASRKFGKKAAKPLETFQNRIMIENAAIAKLLHRISDKMKRLNTANLDEEIDGKFQFEQTTLRDDMKTYIKLHYELKEAMMDFFLKWL